VDDSVKVSGWQMSTIRLCFDRITLLGHCRIAPRIIFFFWLLLILASSKKAQLLLAFVFFHYSQTLLLAAILDTVVGPTFLVIRRLLEADQHGLKSYPGSFATLFYGTASTSLGKRATGCLSLTRRSLGIVPWTVDHAMS
jgi:hypothetical protein